MPFCGLRLSTLGTVASASWRGGVTDTFTGEAHAEGGGGLAQGGIGGWWLLGAAGVFNAAYAHSDYHGLQGGQWALGYSWNNRRFNVNLRSVRSHGDARVLAVFNLASTPVDWPLPDGVLGARALDGHGLAGAVIDAGVVRLPPHGVLFADVD